MADASATWQTPHGFIPVEVAGDVAHRAVRMEMLAVERSDTRSLLAAVLQGMQAKRDEARRIVSTPNSKNAALFAQLVVVERIGRQHLVGLGWRREIAI
jgi:hypothetical protein